MRKIYKDKNENCIIVEDNKIVSTSLVFSFPVNSEVKEERLKEKGFELIGNDNNSLTKYSCDNQSIFVDENFMIQKAEPKCPFIIGIKTSEKELLKDGFKKNNL